MEIAKGKWEVTHEAFTLLVTTEIKGKQESICQLSQRYKTENEIKCNAILIADAGNTYQSTNKLPSELAEANNELLEALKSILKSHRQMSFEKDGNLNDTFIETKIDNLIKKHSNA